MKVFGSALGAQVRRVDSFRRYSGFQELAAVGGREVDARPPPISEMGGHFGSDFVTALADAGADGGVEAGRIGAETGAHGFHGSGGDFRDRAAPAGMHGGDGAEALIGEEDRQAIGGLYRDHGARCVLEKRVAFAENAGAAGGGDALGGMDLFESRQIVEERGDIGEPGPEAMDQPREGVEFGYTIEVLSVLIEHDYAGFWIWAIRTCCLNSSSIDSSRRTSVGRLTRVVI